MEQDCLPALGTEYMPKALTPCRDEGFFIGGANGLGLKD
jgi:hypothetical protein